MIISNEKEWPSRPWLARLVLRHELSVEVDRSVLRNLAISGLQWRGEQNNSPASKTPSDGVLTKFRSLVTLESLLSRLTHNPACESTWPLWSVAVLAATSTSVSAMVSLLAQLLTESAEANSTTAALLAPAGKRRCCLKTNAGSPLHLRRFPPPGVARHDDLTKRYC